MRVVLVTGGCGFIGGAVVRALLATNGDQEGDREGYRVVNLDSVSYAASRPQHDGRPAARYRFVRGNARDFSLLVRVLRHFQVTAVIHCAGETHVDHSFLGYEQSLPFVESNVLGTHALLEAVRIVNADSGGPSERRDVPGTVAADSELPLSWGDVREGERRPAPRRVEQLVLVSTDEVYGNSVPGHRWHTVDDPLRPTNPYAATKASAEMLAFAYQASLGVPVIVTRGSNVYGPGQFPEKVIPKFICRLLLRERARRRQQEDPQDADLSVCIHGDGRSRRSYMFVDDAARALVTVLERGLVGRTYNIAGDASDYEFSTLQLAESLSNIVGNPTGDCDFDWKQLVSFVTNRVFNDESYAMTSSSTAAQQQHDAPAPLAGAANDDVSTKSELGVEALGWSPACSMQEGLERTAKWYRDALVRGSLFGERDQPCWWECGGEGTFQAVRATHSLHEEPELDVEEKP
jgi:dTDP-glucose 4,6-dehydratase